MVCGERDRKMVLEVGRVGRVNEMDMGIHMGKTERWRHEGAVLLRGRNVVMRVDMDRGSGCCGVGGEAT